MTASEVTEDKDLVYGTTDCSCLDRALVILPRSAAQGIADRLGAFGCETWGEVRRECSKEIYNELLGLAGYDTFEEFAEHLQVGQPVPGAREEAARQYEQIRSEGDFPSDDTEFSDMCVPAFGDGDWPPSPFYLMNELLPESIVRQYGHGYTTNYNGDYVEIDPADREKVIAALEALGFSCTEDQELISRLDR